MEIPKVSGEVVRIAPADERCSIINRLLSSAELWGFLMNGFHISHTVAAFDYQKLLINHLKGKIFVRKTILYCQMIL